MYLGARVSDRKKSGVVPTSFFPITFCSMLVLPGSPTMLPSSLYYPVTSGMPYPPDITRSRAPLTIEAEEDR